MKNSCGIGSGIRAGSPNTRKLYLLHFQHYQLAVHFGTLDPGVLEGYQDRLPDREIFSRHFRMEYDRIRFNHLLSIGLNTGRLDAIYRELPKLSIWLQQTRDHLPAGTQLALLYNATIALFVGERWEEAYSMLRRILEHPSRESRADLRDFARVLQLILLYELGHHDLNHFLASATKRYFRRHRRQWEFEAAVARFISACPPGTPGEYRDQKIGELSEVLDQLQAQTDQKFPLTGLNEVRWWLKGMQENRGLSQVYQELVHELGR